MLNMDKPVNLMDVRRVYILSRRPSMDIELIDLINSILPFENDINLDLKPIYGYVLPGETKSTGHILIKDFLTVESRRRYRHQYAEHFISQMERFDTTIVISLCNPEVIKYEYYSRVGEYVVYGGEPVVIFDYYNMPKTEDHPIWMSAAEYFDKTTSSSFRNDCFKSYNKYSVHPRQFLAVSSNPKFYTCFATRMVRRRLILQRIKLMMIWHLQNLLHKDEIRMIIGMMSSMVPFVPLPENDEDPLVLYPKRRKNEKSDCK